MQWMTLPDVEADQHLPYCEHMLHFPLPRRRRPGHACSCLRDCCPNAYILLSLTTNRICHGIFMKCECHAAAVYEAARRRVALGYLEEFNLGILLPE